jgi:coproporphyrinogen III oxidase
MQQHVPFLKELRERVIEKFESYEPRERFEREPWAHHSGGGGEIAVLRGDVFEKAAVNFSAVYGEKFPMADGEGSFFATGISLITHMTNPKAPTVHMNIRYIKTEKSSWYGGGYDLTPMGFPFNEDTEHFHGIAKNTLDRFDPGLYPLFSQQAKEYFYIPHWKKERGVGGIFFDHYPIQTENAFEMWKSIGDTFLNAICPILDKRIQEPYTESDKDLQLKMRAHYVEFNLLYDRGTQFGFKSGGNPNGILCSMPPLAKW